MRFARPLTIALLSTLMSAAGITAAQAADTTPRVDARQAHQQARIADGVASGALTKAETHHLRHQQRHVRQAERHAKADGTVTAQERQRLAKLQNHSSRSTHRQKHDAQVRPGSAG